jgi:membrane protease YdiL (CAAX protease family)
MVVALFYGAWMIASILLFLKKKDLKQMFAQPQAFSAWLIIPLLFACIAFFGIFLPNLHLHSINSLLFINIIICLCNPFLEEIYWRGLPSKMVNSKWLQYLIASVAFAAGHPLILGVNSPGAAGWPTLGGAFILGTAWWFSYSKTRSLWFNVLTHFLINVFGMAAYLLADKVPLLPIPFY